MLLTACRTLRAEGPSKDPEAPVKAIGLLQLRPWDRIPGHHETSVSANGRKGQRANARGELIENCADGLQDGLRDGLRACHVTEGG